METLIEWEANGTLYVYDVWVDYFFMEYEPNTLECEGIERSVFIDDIIIKFTGESIIDIIPPPVITKLEKEILNDIKENEL